MMKAFMKRGEVVEWLRRRGLSRRVFEGLVARQAIDKVYIPPLKPGESPGGRKAFYSTAQVAQAVEFQPTGSTHE